MKRTWRIRVPEQDPELDLFVVKTMPSILSVVPRNQRQVIKCVDSLATISHFMLCAIDSHSSTDLYNPFNDYSLYGRLARLLHRHSFTWNICTTSATDHPHRKEIDSSPSPPISFQRRLSRCMQPPSMGIRRR